MVLFQIPGDLDRSTEALDKSLPLSRGSVRQWQIELEKLTALHNAKTERLEAQLSHTRLAFSKTTVEIRVLIDLTVSLYLPP